MNLDFRASFFVALATLVTACAGPVPKMDMSTDNISTIRTIAVVRPPGPKTYAVLNFGSPAMAFGLLGGLVAAHEQNSKQEALTAAYKAQGSFGTSNLASGIASKLTAAGFEANVEDAPWEEAEGRYKLPFENIKSSADAVLVLFPTIVGFVATGMTADYLPTITVVAVMLGKDRKQQLYRGYHASGWTPKAEGWKSSPAKVTFSNFDALMADPKTSAAALTGAADAIASSIAGDLHK